MGNISAKTSLLWDFAGYYKLIGFDIQNSYNWYMHTQTLYTIGHGDRAIDDFLELLKVNEIEILADVRAQPVSLRSPHFNQEALRDALDKVDITYHWAGRQLGGMRRAQENSPHLALQDEHLRGFADYILTADFDRAATQLVNLTRHATSAILCTEQDPFFCHRSLIADYLVLQGMTVLHIIDAEVREHYLRSEARKESAELIYDHGITAPLELD